MPKSEPPTRAATRHKPVTNTTQKSQASSKAGNRLRHVPKYKIGSMTPEEREELERRIENFPAAVLGALFPVIKDDYRLYFQRLLKKEDQARRCFSWSFYIAEHPGEAIYDVKALKEYVIPHTNWEDCKIVVKVLGPTCQWHQGRSNYVKDRTTMRLSLEDENVVCDFVFPPNPDEQGSIPVHELQYPCEDSD